MTSCEPYGNPAEAKVFIIGHDPRLHTSNYETQYVFCLDYLTKPRPSSKSEGSKYDFATATYSYIEHLTSGLISRKEMYFTNICNEFLDRPNKGIVLIPDSKADDGITKIEEALNGGNPRVIIPMSLQVFYHLVRKGFVSDHQESNLEIFYQRAKPSYKAGLNSYVSTGKSPFLLVCGNKYFHEQLPVVPVLHVKQWVDAGRVWNAYDLKMKNAIVNIKESLKGR